MFPASEWQLVRYARYVANTVTSYETVANYIAGVRTLHRLAGFPVVESSAPNLTHILRGIKFELAHPVKQATPITIEILRDMYNFLDLKDPFDVVCYTAILLGFYMFLRKSNLVPDSVPAFNPGEQLVRSDVRMGHSMVLVEIRWNKTLQYKQRELLLPLIPARDKRVCPVYWLKYMLSTIRAGPQDPLFGIPTGQAQVVPLTYDQLGKKLKKLVALTNRDSQRFTLHGLRKGGACHALESGLVGEDIKIMGDWATEAYMTYLDQTVQRRVHNMVQFMGDL